MNGSGELALRERIDILEKAVATNRRAASVAGFEFIAAKGLPLTC